MKIIYPWLILFNLVHPTQCLNQIKPVPRPKLSGLRRAVVGVIQLALPDVLEGVHLPKESPAPDRLGDLFSLNLFTNFKVLSYLFSSASATGAIENTAKVQESLKAARDVIMDVAKLDANVPSTEYKFWGHPDNRLKELVLLLKTNPFMAQALTETADGGFEIKAFDPKETNPSRYLKFINKLQAGAGHRVNFKFNDKMEFESFAVYDDVLGNQIAIEGNEKEMRDYANKYASAAMYNLLFFASSVHATIHVLHFLTTSALDVASKDYPSLNDWSMEYGKNIAVKYIEVGVILIKPPEKKGIKDFGVITGLDGFGSTQDVRPLLHEVLNDWGEHPTKKGFMDIMYNIDEKKMDKAGILTEFRKHAKLVPDFAKNVKAAFRDIDEARLGEAETTLSKYLKSCGTFESNIETLDQWIEIMSITGLLHGGTLSYSRLIGTKDVAQWRNKLVNKWDAADVKLVTGGLGTVTGMQPGRHVMNNDMAPRGKTYDVRLQAKLDDFDQKTTQLKNEYQRNMLKRKDFEDVGFILSDFCKDNFDGKQLTISTYI